MSGFRKRGALKGAGKVRRILKRLPDEVSAQVVDVYRTEAPAALAYMRGASPSRRIARGLSYRIAEKSLRLRIGLIGKRLNRELFFARILELGRKAQVAKATRRKPGGGVSRYRIRVKAISRARYDFVFGRAATFAFGRIRPQLKNVYEKALRAAAGIGDD
jgi:hypothetical protein